MNGPDLCLFDQILDVEGVGSASSLLEETARLSSAGQDILGASLASAGVTSAPSPSPCSSDGQTGIDMAEADWGETGGGGGTTTDDLLESILTGSEVGKLDSMLNMVVDDDLDMLGNNGNNSNSGGMSSAMSDDGSSSGSDSLSGSAMSPPPSMAAAAAGNIEIVTHTVPAASEIRPLRVIKPTVVALNNASAVTSATNGAPLLPNGVEPIRIITSRPPASASSLATSSASSALQTATTTIVLPVMNIRQQPQVQLPSEPHPPSQKRRRVSASSSDSGVDEQPQQQQQPQLVQVPQQPPSKYPPLVLSDEERRLCEREGVKLPSHYPLSREEERNLKRIRRKIRNKVSAQDSRKRKKEYVDAMEDRVKQCTSHNEQLQEKIDQLETQNRTLAGQVKRLHQMLVNGGLRSAATGANTSTAMMVLLLSTALFLLPGFKDSQSKCSELDISQAIKMPPMPGQSRSLLQFTPVKQEYGSPAAAPAAAPVKVEGAEEAAVKVEKEVAAVAAASSAAAHASGNPAEGFPPKVKREVMAGLGRNKASSPDHDYFGGSVSGGKSMLSAPSPWRVAASNGGGKNHSYIDEDAPPRGYGPDKDASLSEERMVNVTRGGNTGGVRTVVLHVPKDIK